MGSSRKNSKYTEEPEAGLREGKMLGHECLVSLSKDSGLTLIRKATSGFEVEE